MIPIFHYKKGHTPEAQRIAAELQEELERLKSILQRGAVRGVVDNFKDILSPVKQLAKAAKAPAGKSTVIGFLVHNGLVFITFSL